MRNPFLVARAVFFALFVSTSILLIIFASWHIYAITTAGSSAPVAAIFLVLNSCILLCIISIGLVEMSLSRAIASFVLFECAWSAVLGVFQIGTAISVSINNSLLAYQQTPPWDVYASSSLLVPITWLSSFSLLSYFLVLFITTMSHLDANPAIWYKMVATVGWFEHSSPGTASNNAGPVCVLKRNPDVDSWTHYINDIESSITYPQFIDKEEKAPWARRDTTRRGIDRPFTKRDYPSSVLSNQTRIIQPLPSKNKDTDDQSKGSRFIEKIRESRIISRSGNSVLLNHSEPLPHQIYDHDLPIPLPRLSEWIRADAMKGISVHSIPQTPASTTKFTYTQHNYARNYL